MEVLSLVARFVLAVVFLTAGLSKLFVPEQFGRVVRNYRILPEGWVRPTAIWLPRIEIACGLLLLLGVGEQVAAAVMACMLVAFIAAAAWNLLRGREIDCGCFGVSGRRRITWSTVAQNLLLVLAASVVVVEPARVLAVGPMRGAEPGLSATEALAVLISTTLVLVGIITAAEARRFSLAARGARASDGVAG